MGDDYDARQHKKLQKIIAMKKNTAEGILMGNIDIDKLYTKDEILELAKKAGYQQPNSIFTTLTNPLVDVTKRIYATGQIFVQTGNYYKFKENLRTIY